MRCDIIVAGSQNPAVAYAAEILRRIETKTTAQAHRTRGPSIVSGANRLCGIFNDRYTAALRDVEQWIHRGTLPVEMDGHDGFRSRRDRIGNLRGIDVVGARIYINKNRARS